jgi:hypothetical protein
MSVRHAPIADAIRERRWVLGGVPVVVSRGDVAATERPTVIFMPPVRVARR